MPRTKVTYLFYFCLLSGQYINFSNECSCETCFSTVGFFFFIWHSVVYVTYAVTTLAVEFSRIASSSNVINTSSIENETIVCALPQEHWKFTTANTFSTFSAFFSYIIITIFILFPSNWMSLCCQCDSNAGQDGDDEDDEDHCCTTYRRAHKNGTLSPYDDDDKLSTKHKCYFYTNYVVIMLALPIGCIATSAAYIIYFYHQTDCWINALSVTMTVLHLNSQFCAIQSCFIFSKIVYKVTNRLKILAKKIGEAANNMTSADCQHIPSSAQTSCQLTSASTARDACTQTIPVLSCAVPCLLCKEKADREVYHELQKIDQEFIREVKPTLDLFGVCSSFTGSRML